MRAAAKALPLIGQADETPLLERGPANRKPGSMALLPGRRPLS